MIAGSSRRAGLACGLSLLLAAAVSGCAGSSDAAPQRSASPPPTDVVAGAKVGAASVLLVAAGDIARNPDDGKDTAALVEAAKPDAVIALGDTAYDSGSASEFEDNYDPTWGKFKKITKPIPGNHEYKTPAAAGFFDYFRDEIHDQPYYAWNAGRWRVYALNCAEDCGRDSPQLRWLVEDLSEHANKPALAYVHEPLYTCSTRHSPYRRLDDIWTALQNGSGQAVLSGNNHSYERFAPLDAKGQPSDSGMRQFVVGTGGATLYPLVSPCAHREAQDDTTEGILKLQLNSDSYAWQFIGVGGKVLDSGQQAVR